MHTSRLADNPFALMIDPEALLRALESSDRLSRLQRRVCRPLDRPMPGRDGEQVQPSDMVVDSTDVPTEE